MKRTFKVQPDNRGWIRTTLCPVNDKHEASFGLMDVLMFAAVVLGAVAAARMLIAH